MTVVEQRIEALEARELAANAWRSRYEQVLEDARVGREVRLTVSRWSVRLGAGLVSGAAVAGFVWQVLHG